MILPTAHFRVFGALGFHGHIPAIVLADKVLESDVNPAGIALVIAYGNKPGIIQRKHALYEISRLNTVSPEAREILYNNAIDLSGLHHFQKLLDGGSFKVHSAVSVVHKLHDLGILPFRKRHCLLP